MAYRLSYFGACIEEFSVPLPRRRVLLLGDVVSQIVEHSSRFQLQVGPRA